MADTADVQEWVPLVVGTAYTFTTRQLWDYIDTGWKSFVASEWSIATTLSDPPEGMSIVGNATLEGTPVRDGAFTVMLQHKDRYNKTTDYEIATRVGDPPPEPPDDPDAAAVVQMLGQVGNPDIEAMVLATFPMIVEFARAYTRDQGFVAGVPNASIRAVVHTATARFCANPDQVSSTVGGVTIGKGFSGWSLAELAVLNRYRKRAR